MIVETIALAIALPILTLTVLFALTRLIKGPHLPDRVLALDFLSSVAIGFIAVYAIATDNAVLLDIALSVALLSFLGSVAFGYFLENFR
ncbi:MAG TPA: cation:proton antiporter [Anaerolineae bacterium]|nr:cation:proton antiporter [Anaerolineae bacterium]